MSPLRTVKEEYDFSNAVRGALDAPRPGTTQISLWLDEKVLDWFHDRVDRAGGGNYQTLMNDALREHIGGATLEEALRKVLREEFGRAG